MSGGDLARRTEVGVVFGGVDISDEINEYLISITYTDNEEDETDDLQLKLHDRDDIWLTKWLNVAIQAAASSAAPSEGWAVGDDVIANGQPQYTSYGEFTPGAIVTNYKGKITYLNLKSGVPYPIHVGYLGWFAISQVSKDGGSEQNGGDSSSVKGLKVSASLLRKHWGDNTPRIVLPSPDAAATASASDTWTVGEEVTANGRPQYTSYGEGTPGANVTDYKGKVTYLNLKTGIPYPIHVAHLGWFSTSQVTKAAASTDAAAAPAVVQSGDIKLDCGQFELDSVVASGPPSEITVKCTALPYRSSIRKTKKSKAWENYTLSGIAKEMAAANGMTCMYESASDPFYERKEQSNTSDIAFLKKLCQAAGLSLKATDNMLVLFDQAKYEAKHPVVTIPRGKRGGYEKYKLSTGEADTHYASCRVRYTDPATGAVITATAYAEDYDPKKKDNQCLEIKAKVGSTGEAQALASKMLRLRNKYEYSASFTFPGNPSLVAGVTAKLTGWGAWDGKYIVKQAKHSVGGSGYKTQIALRRVLEGY